jgi:hypothetical protein
MSVPRRLLLAGLVLLGAVAAHAVPVPGLFDTGVDSAGVALSAGAVDPHFALVASADLVFPGPQALVATGLASGNWFANTATSQWIAPALDENWPAMGTALAAGDYVYRLTFDLAGIDPGTVSVAGTYGADNAVLIRLNGVPVGPGISTYSPLVAFSVGSGFVSGVNHMDFVVTNWAASGSNPSGLRVRDLAGRNFRTLVDGDRAAGRQEAIWDGTNDAGVRAGSGIYFVELEANGRRASRRMAWLH